MNPVSEQEIAEFIKHFQDLDASEEEPLKEDDGPLMHSEAQDFAKQLGDYLRKLHKEDLDSHIANNTWLQQIDKAIKALDGEPDVAGAAYHHHAPDRKELRRLRCYWDMNATINRCFFRSTTLTAMAT